jgi:hypothetical protein
MDCLTTIFVWMLGIGVVCGLLAALLTPLINKFEKKRFDRLDALARQHNLLGVTFGGAYLTGHPEIEKVVRVLFGATSQDIVILADETGSQLSRIPHTSVTSLTVHDETHTESILKSRVTLARLTLLGPLAVATPKQSMEQVTKPRFLLDLQWMFKGLQQTTSFLFVDRTDANAALAFLMKHRPSA